MKFCMSQTDKAELGCYLFKLFCNNQVSSGQYQEYFYINCPIINLLDID